jgi:ABC-type multidrug transport system fused ATPase/permease subunit
MGEPMIRSRYDRVIDNAKLDVQNFQGGDMIEVLSQGLNFSASERRKILLARMLYVAGDIYIIKDFFGHEEDEIE